MKRNDNIKDKLIEISNHLSGDSKKDIENALNYITQLEYDNHVKEQKISFLKGLLAD